MVEIKRGRGRPRKEESVKKVENPDCEPATKGYVKCIARTTIKSTQHTHKVSYDLIAGGFVISFLVVLFGMVGWIFSSDHGGLWQIVIPIWWINLELLVIFIVASSTDNFECTSKMIWDDDKLPEALVKYEPPKCEKKECE